MDISISEFVQKIVAIDNLDEFYDKDLIFMFCGRRAVVRPAYFNKEECDGFDLIDTTFFALGDDPELEDMCIFSWKECEPETLRLHIFNPAKRDYLDEDVEKVIVSPNVLDWIENGVEKSSDEQNNASFVLVCKSGFIFPLEVMQPVRQLPELRNPLNYIKHEN